MPSRPFSAKRTSIPCASSALVSAKTLRTSSSTISTFLPSNTAVGAVQLLEHLALLVRQLRLDAVEEERRLVEQPLGRARVLDDDRLGVALQPRLLALRQLLRRCRRSPAGGAKRSSLFTFSSSAKPVIFGSFRSSTMQSNGGCSSSAASASSVEPTATISTSPSPPTSSTIDVALRLVVLDDEQALARRGR